MNRLTTQVSDINFININCPTEGQDAQKKGGLKKTAPVMIAALQRCLTLESTAFTLTRINRNQTGKFAIGALRDVVDKLYKPKFKQEMKSRNKPGNDCIF